MRRVVAIGLLPLVAGCYVYNPIATPEPAPGTNLSLVLSDEGRKLAEAVAVIHPHSAMDGGDTAAPTTILVDGRGTVRWTFRPDRVLTRLSPAELLTAIDREMPAR